MRQGGAVSYAIAILGGAIPQWEIAMARSKPSKQLSQAEIERFLVAAEALHLSIIKPFISPSSEHHRALQRTHEALLKAVKDITGKDAKFIAYFGAWSK